jgi:hypothetical protein
MSEIRQFLNELFEYKPDEAFILIWTCPDKRSRWFQDVGEAASYCESLKEREIYFGLGLAKKDHGPHVRCPAIEVIGIVAFWVDLDCKSAAHTKQNLPPTLTVALGLLPPEFPPTLVVHSGNGAHAYWKLKEEWTFEDDAERERAHRLVLRWQTFIRLEGSKKGWGVDRVADLARVLRVAGTENRKDPAQIKPVRIIQRNERQYNPSDFEDFLDARRIPKQLVEEKTSGEWAKEFADTPIVISYGAVIPDNVLQGWMEADPQFKATWFRQRLDLRDDSQSGYDYSLVNFGLDAGLALQQIVDLIIHHRRKHKQKARTRLDYYQRTIGKILKEKREQGMNAMLAGTAPQPAQPVTAASAVSQPAPEQAQAGPQIDATEEVEDVRARCCLWLTEKLGVGITQIVKIKGKDPTYLIRLDQGTIKFDTFSKFRDQTVVRDTIGGAVDRMPRKFKAKEWEQEIVPTMLRALTVREGGEEAELEGGTVLWLRQYLSGKTIMLPTDDRISQETQAPVIVDGRIAILSTQFHAFVNHTYKEKESLHAIFARLEVVGARNFKINSRGPLRGQSRWALPVEKFDPATYRPDYAPPAAENNHGGEEPPF